MAQLSEIFRRGVVTPIDDDAARQLSQWFVEASCRVDFLWIPDDQTFSAIWNAGVFQGINAACGTRIGDYEEEVLEPTKLNAVARVLEAKLNELQDGEARSFTVVLLAQCRAAETANYPVYFVL